METQNKMENKQNGKIDWKRLILKSLEEGAKKAIEIVILVLVLGSTMKLVLFAVPAVMTGTALVKIIKIGVFKQ